MDEAATRALYRERGLAGRVGFGERPALLLVDLIRGFTDPACPLGANLDAEVAAAQELLAATRARGWPVHFTTIAYASGAPEGGPFVRKIPSLAWLTHGSCWIEVDARLAPRADEVTWVKKGASAFFGTGLAAALVADRIDTLLIAGCTTSGCVRASAVDACQHGFRTIVVREAVGDRAAGPHAASLFDLDAKYADVLALAAALANLEAVGARAEERA
ncbi:MAG: carbamoylsarcosine amidase [Proteobacteria bacterium]|nr:MAG: carbamoylsarcosine amidase [Pseudomonadota bacterium]